MSRSSSNFKINKNYPLLFYLLSVKNYMDRIVNLILISILLSSCSISKHKKEPNNFPGKNWENSDESTRNAHRTSIAQIDSIMKASHANGALIKDGKIISSWSYDKPSDEKIEVQSITKTIVSLLLGIAIDEKKIKSINSKVIDYYPAFDVGPYTDKITFHHLVTISSGISAIKHGENYGNPNNMKPGIDARYHNDHFHHLARVLTYVYRESLLSVLKSRVLLPLQAEVEWATDGEVTLQNGNKILVYAGYAFTKWTAADLAKIGYLYLHKGNWNGKQIVSAKYVKYSMTPISIPLMISRPNQPLEEDLNNTYGYGWRGIKIAESDILWHASGNGGQFCAIVPEKNVVFVKINGYQEKYKPYRGLGMFKDILSKL